MGHPHISCKKFPSSTLSLIFIGSWALVSSLNPGCSLCLPISYAGPRTILWLEVVVQSLGRVQLFVTPRTAACWASLSFTIFRSLPKLMSIESVMPSNHLILCRPFLLMPIIFRSIRVFSNESILYIRWPKYWSFNFSISPSSEYSGLISFRIDWFDLLAVQGPLRSLLLLGLRRRCRFSIVISCGLAQWTGFCRVAGGPDTQSPLCVGLSSFHSQPRS